MVQWLLLPAEGAVLQPSVLLVKLVSGHFFYFLNVCAVMLLLCGPQADLNYVQDDPAAFYGVTSQYESSENMTITCSTKVCSFGKQVVEKVEVRLSVMSLFFF